MSQNDSKWREMICYSPSFKALNLNNQPIGGGFSECLQRIDSSVRENSLKNIGGLAVNRIFQGYWRRSLVLSRLRLVFLADLL
jgi:hypothetical protein